MQRKNLMITIYEADNLDVLEKLSSDFSLIYIDPPFNTGKTQSKKTIKVKTDSTGNRVGFGGKRFSSTEISSLAYADKYDNFAEFLFPRLLRARDLLVDNGSLFVHLDYREVHYIKVMLDEIFGRASFMNEIIWAYDYGARSKTRWSAKHDSILWYAKNPSNYIWNYDQIDRIPYLAPSLVGPEKAARGKTVTDVWWNTIVCGKEKTGYPTQKPLAILNRIVKVHSNVGDNLLDFFAGSGSFGESAVLHNRNVTLIDSNPEAIKIMLHRFATQNPIIIREEK